MQGNRVAALISEAFTALPQEQQPPREVLIPWLSERQKAENWHRHQREVQDEIVGLLKQEGIETLVLKGTHLAELYPKPELRQFGDLDLYFYDRHDEADRIVADRLKVAISDDAHHHTKYNYRGVTIESHYTFTNTHYPPSNRRYEALLKDLVDSRESLPTFEILFLLRHMACHFAASRLTLRDLADWTLTCRAMKDKADWQVVEKTITDYGMTEFVAALNDITHYPLIERDLVYGSTDDHTGDGIRRLAWKLRRWRVLGWKRRLVFNDPPLRLLLASLSSHAMKPQSILHKM